MSVLERSVVGWRQGEFSAISVRIENALSLARPSTCYTRNADAQSRLLDLKFPDPSFLAKNEKINPRSGRSKHVRSDILVRAHVRSILERNLIPMRNNTSLFAENESRKSVTDIVEICQNSMR